MGFLALTVPGNTSVGFTSQVVSGTTHFSIPAGANVALLICETGACRFRDDGVTATATVGMIIQPTLPTPFEYSGDLSVIQFCGVTGTVAIDASFYRTIG